MEGSTVTAINGVSNASSSKSASASKSHSEAERRRRERINAHLATLRTLLPNTTKTDKASLLAEVVQHVKELRNRAENRGGDGGVFPGEADELTVGLCEGGLVRVTVCCEDRPGLLSEVTRAVGSARGRVVRAEMSTVGGRTRSALVVEFVGKSNKRCEDDETLGVLRRAFKPVLDSSNGSAMSGVKRPRILSHPLIY